MRLPRLIGISRALDLILTGRPVGAEEALAIGLVNRVVPKGQSREAALDLAALLAGFPQECLRVDRRSVYEQWDMPLEQALANEFRRGSEVARRGARQGANAFLQAMRREEPVE